MNETSSASSAPASLSYKDAGVDIDAGNALVDRIKHVAQSTSRPEVMGGLGGFGALCELPAGYRQPVLVSGTDGVGTKLRVAMELDRHDTIGIDLVAMCVNDLLVIGAEPLQFLDYYATGRLNVDIAADVVTGIGEGCRQAGCALVGGETAEMPGMYSGNDYDLAGFCIGVAEKSAILDGSRVDDGDVILGLASSGPHSNGYSLIRRILDVSDASLETTVGDTTLGDALMAPTRIYVKPLLSLMHHSDTDVHALSHITGGGLLENLPRILPEHLAARLDAGSWQRPEIFNWLQRHGNVDDTEMHRVFNCGIGMALVVPADQVEQAWTHLEARGETVYRIGSINTRGDDEDSVTLTHSSELTHSELNHSSEGDTPA